MLHMSTAEENVGASKSPVQLDAIIDAAKASALAALERAATATATAEKQQEQPLDAGLSSPTRSVTNTYRSSAGQ